MDLFLPTCLLDFFKGIGRLVFLELPALREAVTPKENEGLARRFNDLGWDSPALLANIVCIIFVIAFLLPLIPVYYIRQRNLKNERVIEVARRYWEQ